MTVAGVGFFGTVAGVLLLLAAALLVRCRVGLLVRGVRQPAVPGSVLCLVRGLQGVVVALALVALAGGLVFGQGWLLVFGAVFLAEELYETGLLILVLRTSGEEGTAA